MSKRRAIFYVVGAAVAAGLLLGAYAGFARFLKDRDAALGYSRRPEIVPGVRREVKTYTPEELEAARREGRAPRPVPGSGNAAVEAGQAAIQRQLKAVDEINRINEMNRRLMEQQKRMQNQR